MVRVVAGSPLGASLPVFQSSPFEPYTCSYTAVRLMVSRLRGRACSTNAPGDSTESGAFSFCMPLLWLAKFLGPSPCAVKPSVQPACICFKSSRLWLSSSRTRFCSARASAE